MCKSTGISLLLVPILAAGADTLTVGSGACDLQPGLLVDGGTGIGGIAELTFPEIVSSEDPGARYLFPSDRVLGLVVNGEDRAYPHNILWWHEIVNDDVGGTLIAVSYCPLTGSGLAWESSIGGRDIDFQVSGTLYGNNLVMFDRATGLYGPGYPFGELVELGTSVALNEVVGGEPILVLYEGSDGESALAYGRSVGGQALTFEVAPSGLRDLETSSPWDRSGRAVEGLLSGQQLTAVPNAYVAFWFAWRFFQVDAEIFEAESI